MQFQLKTGTISLIDKLLNTLISAINFSKINLTASYKQVFIYEEDIPKTTFRTKYGSYKSLVMNFGITYDLFIFATLMNSVFKEELGKTINFILG